MIKSILKLLIPNSILNFRSNRVEKKRHSLYKELAISDVFENIYTNHEWGIGNGEFYSGSGTHNIDITKPYIEAVISVLKSLPNKPIVVDIGSGDFNIGNNFVEFVEYYYACDIVPLLQAHNRKILMLVLCVSMQLRMIFQMEIFLSFVRFYSTCQIKIYKKL